MPAVPPEAGHGTARIDLAAGRRNGRSHASLALRPAYHDLLDPEGGYSRGAQIQFLLLELDHVAGQGLQLARFTPVDIVSLNPSNALLGGTSWKVRFGSNRSFAPTRAATGSAAPAASDSHDAALTIELNGGPGKGVGAGRRTTRAHLCLHGQPALARPHAARHAVGRR